MELTIISEHFNNDDLIKRLEGTPGWNSSGIKLSLKKSKSQFRMLDSTVIAAVCSAAGIGLGALIKGLLDICKSKIVIEIDDGKTKTRIEVPHNCSKEKLQDYIKIIKDSVSAKIEV